MFTLRLLLSLIWCLPACSSSFALTLRRCHELRKFGVFLGGLNIQLPKMQTFFIHSTQFYAHWIINPTAWSEDKTLWGFTVLNMISVEINWLHITLTSYTSINHLRMHLQTYRWSWWNQTFFLYGTGKFHNVSSTPHGTVHLQCIFLINIDKSHLKRQIIQKCELMLDWSQYRTITGGEDLVERDRRISTFPPINSCRFLSKCFLVNSIPFHSFTPQTNQLAAFWCHK